MGLQLNTLREQVKDSQTDTINTGAKQDTGTKTSSRTASDPQSVGIVTPHNMVFNEPFRFRSGQSIPHFTITYETYGELNAAGSNAVLVCHALSGDHHAAGFHSTKDRKPGWWDNCIGPGKPIDTNHFFVVSSNNLGGCHGSTGPNTINLETSQPYGPDFPIVTVEDWVKLQALLADRLGIQQWAAVVGGSLGGMQAMQWAIDYPDRLRHSLIIAAAPKLSAQNIAFNEIARQAILRDPDFHDGHFYGASSYPKRGLTIARMLGHVTYNSEVSMREKFGRELKTDDFSFNYNEEFQVESYLRYQGETFSEKFDANTYLLMTKALDYYDPAAKHGDDLAAALAHTQCKFLVLSFTTDWRFPPDRSEEIVNALVKSNKNVSYMEIDDPRGHDAFLLKVPRFLNLFQTYMNTVADENTVGGRGPMSHAP